MVRQVMGVLSVLVVMTMVVAGCSTPEPGVTNEVGTVTALLKAEPDAVTQAATRTLEDMDLVIVSSEASKLDGKVTARTAQDRKIKIEIERSSEGVSEIGIRVGTWGDEEVSLAILDKIKTNLGLQ